MISDNIPGYLRQMMNSYPCGEKYCLVFPQGEQRATAKPVLKLHINQPTVKADVKVEYLDAVTKTLVELHLSYAKLVLVLRPHIQDLAELKQPAKLAAVVEAFRQYAEPAAEVNRLPNLRPVSAKPADTIVSEIAQASAPATSRPTATGFGIEYKPGLYSDNLDDADEYWDPLDPEWSKDEPGEEPDFTVEFDDDGVASVHYIEPTK